jgi:outer membrane protein assembly factor BamB
MTQLEPDQLESYMTLTANRSIKFSVVFAALALTSAADSETVEDASWPYWRGPARNGVSTETKWQPEGKPEDLWSLDVGLGYSAVSIDNGRLYTMGHDKEKGVDSVWCLNPVSGEEIWSHEYEAALWNFMHGGGTLGTPTIDGEALYTLNREGKLFCFDATSGEVRWKMDVTEKLGAEPGKWGFSASPVVDGDSLLINIGKMVSMDKKTGKVSWETRDYGHSYSTPTPFELRGRPALALLNSEGLAILDRTDGEELYFHEWKTKYDINAASPIIDGDTVFISSGLNRGGAMLRMGEEELEVLWESKAMRNKMNGCVQLGDYLYGFDEAILKCIDKKGEVKWSERGLGQGALSATVNRLLLTSDQGELIILEATPGEYKELSRTHVIEDGGVYWTTPVILDGLIYVRGSGGQLVCRDHR